jgi:hypothetical protein
MGKFASLMRKKHAVAIAAVRQENCRENDDKPEKAAVANKSSSRGEDWHATRFSLSTARA